MSRRPPSISIRRRLPAEEHGAMLLRYRQHIDAEFPADTLRWYPVGSVGVTILDPEEYHRLRTRPGRFDNHSTVAIARWLNLWLRGAGARPLMFQSAEIFQGPRGELSAGFSINPKQIETERQSIIHRLNQVHHPAPQIPDWPLELRPQLRLAAVNPNVENRRPIKEAFSLYLSHLVGMNVEPPQAGLVIY